MVYRRTYNGKISVLYNNIKSRQNRYSAKPIQFTKDEFKVWLEKNGYWDLYNKWVESNFQEALSPSVDRLNDFKCYSFDNMQLKAWRFNQRKSKAKQCKIVYAINIKTSEVSVFKSTVEASIKTGVAHSNIGKVARGYGNRTQAGGFIWSYTEPQDALST